MRRTEQELVHHQRIVRCGRVRDERVAQREVVVERAHDRVARSLQLLEERLDVGHELIPQRDVLFRN